MIYSYYKSNYALVLFGLPLVISLLWLGQILEGVNAESIQDSSTIFSLLKGCFKYGFVDQLVALVIILVSAVLLNSTINREEFFEKHTFLPAYTYVVVMSVFSDYQLLHPIILSNFFMVLAIRRLFHIKRATDARRMMFDAGFFLGIAAIFYEYYIGFYLLAWSTLAVLRPFVWREHVLGLIGLTVPFLFLLFYHFIVDEPSTFLTPLFPKDQYKFSFISTTWIKIGISVFVVLFMAILGAQAFLKRQKRSSLRFKRISNIILFMGLIILLLSGVYMLLKYKIPAVFLGAILASFLSSFYFFYAKNQKIAGSVFYLINILIVLNIYYPLIANIF